MNKKPTKTPQQRNLKQLPRLTKLNLEQLESVAGGGIHVFLRQNDISGTILSYEAETFP